MICNRCGKEIDNNSKYCYHCGNIFEDSKLVESGSNSNNSPQVKKGKANKGLKITFFSILGLCILIVAIITIVVSTGTSSEVDVFSILEGNPKIPDEVVTEWGEREYSLNMIGQAGKVVEANASMTSDGSESNQGIDEQEQADENNGYSLKTDILGSWEVSYEHDYMGIDFLDNGVLRYVEIAGDEHYDKIIDYEVVSENEIMLGNDPQNIVLLRVDYDEQFDETYLILGPESDFTELYKVDSLIPPSYLNEVSYTIEDFISSYNGMYQNNSGDMNLQINIREYVLVSDTTYRVIADFNFSPKDSNSAAKSGKYEMVGEIEVQGGRGVIWLNGYEWISKKPASNYNMLDLEGVIDLSDGTFNGNLKRDNKPAFYLSKE